MECDIKVPASEAVLLQKFMGNLDQNNALKDLLDHVPW